MQAGGEEFCPFVEGGQVLLGVHYVEFFTDTQPASLCAGLVGGGSREELPLDARLQTLVFQRPDIAGQPGVLPLARMLEVRLVVAKP